jgi:V-type H+-transporting ATPase subunit G
MVSEKTSRLRQAKEEADAEVATYRAQREATYQKMLAAVRARASAGASPSPTPTQRTHHHAHA